MEGEYGGWSCPDVGGDALGRRVPSDARRMRLKKWGSVRSPNPAIGLLHVASGIPPTALNSLSIVFYFLPPYPWVRSIGCVPKIGL